MDDGQVVLGKATHSEQGLLRLWLQEMTEACPAGNRKTKNFLLHFLVFLFRQERTRWLCGRRRDWYFIAK